ncbi:DNA repair XRCC2-like isoform 3 [Schistosoma japonicum]|uniref:DNA repair XRCC2-like isoform 3 n=2 Tax=Schistosoma japonicum TaxID=6182 RepID=A0A4Z2D823_SCHJA|nr:DNA repair XRCC2-like isoform 3 [Schistosoma japonicum]
MSSANISVETGSALLVRSQNRPYIDSLLFDYFPSQYAPESGKSLVEVCQSYYCGCSDFLYHKLMQCALPKTYSGFHLDGYNTHCLLINCEGRFSASEFRKFVQLYLQNKIPASNFDYNQHEVLLGEVLSRVHIIPVFTDCELLLALCCSREVIKQHPVSCLIISSINAFTHLERLRYSSWKSLANQRSILMSTLLRLIADFQLLCVIILRYPLGVYAPSDSLGTDAFEISYSNNLLCAETKSDDWSKYVTHKIELIDCEHSFVSYIKHDSNMKVVKDTRVS